LQPAPSHTMRLGLTTSVQICKSNLFRCASRNDEWPKPEEAAEGEIKLIQNLTRILKLLTHSSAKNKNKK